TFTTAKSFHRTGIRLRKKHAALQTNSALKQRNPERPIKPEKLCTFCEDAEDDRHGEIPSSPSLTKMDFHVGHPSSSEPPSEDELKMEFFIFSGFCHS